MFTNIRKAYALLPFMFLTLCVTAQQSQDTTKPLHLSIERIWEQAELNNKRIEMSRLRVESSEEALKDAKAERLPEINAAGAYARVTNMPVYEDGLFHTPQQFPVLHNYYKVGGEAYFNIYNGNKTNLEIKKEATEHVIAEQQKNLTVSEVKFNAAVCYLDLARSCRFKELIAKDIAEQEKQLAHIRELQKNGVVLKSDVLRAELKLSRQQMGMVQINNDIAISSQKLAIMIGADEHMLIEPDSLFTDQETIPGTYEEYLTAATDHAYEFKISEGETALKELSLKQVKANVSPKVGLFAEYAWAYPQIQFYPYAAAMYGLGMYGVKASFPISSFYHNKHKEKVAQLQLERQEVEHKETGDEVRQQVNEAFLRYKEALTRIDVAETNVKQATENLRIVNNTYFNQLSLVTDLLDADTQMLQTRFDLVSANIAARVRYYQLQKVIGNL
ncbi:TolC family protein [Chitinophaga sp. CF418]|uniref:TolC family protein n=1 Tax=Chitinophaga sp. CF418 TaxID=1855287 RepID=UPI0009123A70|nr:TolC family protein [Chitinophaga sp. CF418]SHM94126.1 Outer membrane protein TolC [Chitinophaga sp. CF418]